MNNTEKLKEIQKLEGLSVDELLQELRTREGKARKRMRAMPLKLNENLREFDDATIGEVLKTKQKAIYGTDDRKDIYQLPTGSDLDDADSVVALFTSSKVINNGDGTSTLQTQNFGVAKNLCANEHFRGQPIGAFCSGFLVAPDIIATAGHCVSTGDVTNIRFVFGFRMRDESAAETVIKNTEIYSGIAIIGRQEVESGPDWSLVHIDRPVTNHRIARIRLSGRVGDTQALHVIGHPVGLPTKFAGGAAIRNNQPDAFFVANLDTYGGNSGSPVFNSDTHEVEGILVRGDKDFVQQGNCQVSLICPDTGCRGEDCTRANEFATILEPRWHHNNLTGATGAPAADSDPAGYTCDADKTRHVVYRSNDGNIYELRFDGQGNYNNLTGTANAPTAVGNPAGYTCDADKTRYVVYRDKDGNIYELWFKGQGNYNNLTLLIGAPTAFGDPAGYTCDVDKTQHVFYRGNEGNIHELWLNF